MINKIIPYGKQDISKEDIESVVNVLNSDFLTQGPVVGIFENQSLNVQSPCFYKN